MNQAACRLWLINLPCLRCVSSSAWHSIASHRADELSAQTYSYLSRPHPDWYWSCSLNGKQREDGARHHQDHRLV